MAERKERSQWSEVEVDLEGALDNVRVYLLYHGQYTLMEST